MINQQLLDFIKKQLREGISKDTIYTELLGNSWTTQDIEEAFNAISIETPHLSGVPTSPVVVKTKSRFYKKVLLTIVILLLVAGGVSAYFFINGFSRLPLNNTLPQYFTDRDVYPTVEANVNEKFVIHIGQAASFKEGFKVMMVGYESMCGGGNFEHLKDSIIQRAEASQCSPGTSIPIYVFIKDGKVLGHNESYIFGYEIFTISDLFNRSGYSEIIVQPVEQKVIDERKSQINNRAAEQEAKKENDPSACLKITDEKQKDNCISFLARGTYFEMSRDGSKLVTDLTPAISSVRNLCKNMISPTGICSIVGKTTVLSPTECFNLIQEEEWLGSTFYEDCFDVSMHLDSSSPNICFNITTQSLKQSCLVSYEKGRTLNLNVSMDSLPKNPQ